MEIQSTYPPPPPLANILEITIAQEQRMKNFSAQHKTLQGEAILMLVRHMGELLCSFSHSGGLELSLFTMF